MRDGLYLSLGLVWFAFLLRALRGVRHLQPIEEVAGRFRPADRAPISIIIAAKDNAPCLAKTLRDLREFQYDELEVIVVNDRSTDDSDEVIRRFTSADKRFKQVFIGLLPEGWLGKVHALHHGTLQATGDYLLFMDADIRISAPLLDKAVTVCEGMDLDHLAVLPRAEARGFWLDLLITTSEILFTMSARPWLSIADRPVHCVKGVGSFNFLRRSFFEETRGFEWLKMEVADDVALAQLIAQSGGRSFFTKTNPRQPEASFAWYPTVKEMIRGLEKNTVGGFTNYQLWRVVGMVSSSLGAVLVPLSAFLFLPASLALTYGVGFVFSTFLFAVAARPYLARKVAVLMSFPLGIAFLGWILLRSALRCFKNQGITWSGTFYPLDALRAGVRVRLGL